MPETTTVLLLGAGASAASEEYKLPTMRGFFSTEILTPDETKKGGAYHLLWKFLKDYYGITRRSSKKLAEVNLEEVITHFHNIEHLVLPIDRRRKGNLSEASKELDDYVYARLVSEPLARYPASEQAAERSVCYSFCCKRHAEVFCKLDLEQDSILTLNYDLVADGTLLWMKENKPDDADSPTRGMGGVTGPFMERSKGLIGIRSNWDIKPIGPTEEEIKRTYFLKLHGSLDYVYCPNPMCQHHFAFSPNQNPRRTQDVMASSFCKLCGMLLVRAIVPPALGKSMEEFPRIKVIWSMAFNKLRDANRWIIWGVSLAESDHQLRFLLREAAHEGKRKRDLEVFVIDPNCKVGRKVKDVVQGNTWWSKDAEAWLRGEHRLLK